MPGVVVDASAAAGWFIGDEASPYSDAVLATAASTGVLVPSLWSFEIANMLAVAERRGRATADEALEAWQWLGGLKVDIDPPRPMQAMPALTRIAREHDLTAYGAAYLELAIRARATLATLDGALEQAAARAGVPLFSV